MKIKVIKVNVEILVALKALEAQGITLEDIKNADINEDGVIDSFDNVGLRKILINQYFL